MTSNSLPNHHRALVLSSFSEPPKVKRVPTSAPTAGSATVQILVASVLPFAKNVYNGTMQYPMPTPLIIGSSAIGRIAAVGPDATSLSPGQLVLVDIFIRGRDDPGASFLFGLHQGATEGSRRLMEGEWRNATYQQFAKVPLENLYALDEKRLLDKVEDGGLGYTIDDLTYLSRMLVPFGGLRDLAIQVGETVVIAPATGAFGGAAVDVAVALGAQTIVAGRNMDALKIIASKSDRIKIVQLKGDVQADAEALQKFGPIDAYLDFSPTAAAKSTHIKSCLLALKPFGRAAFMGGILEDVPIPYPVIMFKSIQLKGRFMYDHVAPSALIKMAEVGLLKLGESAGLRVAGKFPLEQWEKAIEAAETNSGYGVQVLLAP